MNKSISIASIASISALGSDSQQVWNNYRLKKHFLTTREKNHSKALQIVATLNKTDKERITHLRAENKIYKSLDNSVLYAMITAKQAMQSATWLPSDNIGINIGSSRGASALFEKYHTDFINQNKLSPLSSPTTTLGNISSWVADYLNTLGPNISHSVTCSTSLHAILNAVAWMKADMCDKFIVGGSEAPLTDFTLAQMQALKITASEYDAYPCKALLQEKTTNTMVLGEAAAMACLQVGESSQSLAVISGIGYATEILHNNTSISADAECLQKSMHMAIADTDKSDVDVIITHTPGTIQGDAAELNAIRVIFGKSTPAITTNKWKLGHTLASSGMLSVELAILMLTQKKFIPVPYLSHQKMPKKINTVLVNAVGFGGNAVSLLLTAPSIN